MTDDTFDDVLSAFAVDLGHEVGEPLDYDAIYAAALEAGLFTEAQLEESFDRVVMRVLNEHPPLTAEDALTAFMPKETT